MSKSKKRMLKDLQWKELNESQLMVDKDLVQKNLKDQTAWAQHMQSWILKNQTV